MRRGGSRLAASALAIVAFVVLLGANAPLAPGALRVASFAATPGSANTGGGILDGLLGLVILGVLAVAVIVAVGAAAVILYRTRAPRATRVPEEGWWTCQTCGAGNLDGAARCHACSTWRTTIPHPTTTA